MNNNYIYFDENGVLYESSGTTGLPLLEKIPTTTTTTTAPTTTTTTTAPTTTTTTTEQQLPIILELDSRNTLSYPGTGTTWYDLSTSAKEAILYNGVAFNTNTLVFDGVDDFCRVNSVVSGATYNVSMEVVFNCSNVNKSDQMIAYNGDDSSANGFGIAVNSESTIGGQILILYGGVAWLETYYQLFNNTWYHVVMTITQDTTLKMYVNGSEVHSQLFGIHPNTPTNYFDIGINSYGSRNFVGSIQSVRMYNKTLSSNEVSTIYNQNKF